jgi:ABC-type Zn2+ transport system substrate-binding protein/surface adhesin
MMGDLRGFLENQDYLGAVDVVRPPVVGPGPNDNQNQNPNHNHNNEGHGHGHNHRAEAFDEEDVDVGEMDDWNGLLESESIGRHLWRSPLTTQFWGSLDPFRTYSRT